MGVKPEDNDVKEDKQKVSFSPEIKMSEAHHIPVIKAKLPHKKISMLQRKGDDLEDKFTRTAGNFNFHHNDDSSDLNPTSNKLAFSEVFETSPQKEFLSPEAKRSPIDFTLKSINFSAKSPCTSHNSIENVKPPEGFNVFKRKSAVFSKSNPGQGLSVNTEASEGVAKNGRRIGDLKIFYPGVIKKKEELIEKIQKKKMETFGAATIHNFDKMVVRTETIANSACEFPNKKKNHAKIRLTEAFQKAEIYNDKVVRQINFEKENQEEEKNFQELFDVLNSLN